MKKETMIKTALCIAILILATDITIYSHNITATCSNTNTRPPILYEFNYTDCSPNFDSPPQDVCNLPFGKIIFGDSTCH